MAINLGSITFGIIPNVAALGPAMAAVGRFGAGVAQSLNGASTAAGRFVNAMGQSQVAATRAGSATRSAADQLRQLSSAAVLVSGPMAGFASRISVLTTLTERFSGTTAMMVAGVAVGAGAFLSFGLAAISVERRLQTIEQTFAAVSGSMVIAQTQLNYLSGFADKAGVKIDDLAKGFGSIQAASKGTILEGERTRDIFEAITLAGGKLGLSGEEVKGTLTAIQQIMSKGKVSAEELRQQLGDRLPGAVQIMATALGVTTQKLDGMMRKGELGISTLVKFAVALKTRYNIDDSTKIDTIASAENRLYNARFRAIDQLDKVIGFSSAYKNILNALTDALNGNQSKAGEYVNTLIKVATALAVAFIAPRIIDGIAAITMGIGRLAAGIMTLNAVSAAGAFTSFLRLFATAAIAIAAYYGSEKLLQNTLGETKQSYLNALPAVEAYIEANKNALSSDRMPTNKYIEEQKAQLDSLTAKRKELADQMKLGLGKLDLAEQMGATNEQVTKLGENQGIYTIRDQIVAVDSAIDKAKGNMKALDDILSKQTTKETTNRTDPVKDMTNRQTLAIKNATDTVKELDRAYEGLYKAPAAKEWGEVQNGISKAVENFRDQLTRTDLPATKVTELTNNYAASLRKVKEAEYNLAHTTSYFQAIEGVFGRGMETGMNNFIDAVLEGKDQMEALRDTAKAVAADIFKTFMQLAVLNPIKNMLFGTNANVLGGSGGIGGLLGGMFGGSSSSGAMQGPMPDGSVMSPFAMGGIMTASGSKPLRRYSSGGIANSSQFAEFGEGSKPEAYVPLPDGRTIPVTMAGGGGGMEVHVHEAPGQKATPKKSSGMNGDRLDIYMQDIAVGGTVKDISSGGPLSQILETQYGLKRTTGMST